MSRPFALVLRLSLGLSLLFAGGTAEAKPTAPRQFGGPALSRSDFNRPGIQTSQPFFWISDANKNKLIVPQELGARGNGKLLRRLASDFWPRHRRGAPPRREPCAR